MASVAQYACRLLSMMLLSTKPKAAAVSKAAGRQAGLVELLLYQMKLWPVEHASGITIVSYAALALSRLVTGSDKVRPTSPPLTPSHPTGQRSRAPSSQRDSKTPTKR